MTAAGVHQAAPGAASAPAARPGPAWLRLAWLYLVSRRAPVALALLAGLGALLWAALHWHWNVAGGHAAQLMFPLVTEAGAAAVIAATTYGPFGEPERATGRWLPYLRLGAALALTGIAISALQLGRDRRQPVRRRPHTGAQRHRHRRHRPAVLAGHRRPARLDPATWLPGVRRVRTERGLAQPVDLARPPPADRGAWICAAGVFAIGLAAVTFRGARTSLADNG